MGSSAEVGEDALALLVVPLAGSVLVMTDPWKESLLGWKDCTCTAEPKARGSVEMKRSKCASAETSGLLKNGERRTRWWTCCVSVLHHLDSLSRFES